MKIKKNDFKALYYIKFIAANLITMPYIVVSFVLAMVAIFLFFGSLLDPLINSKFSFSVWIIGIPFFALVHVFAIFISYAGRTIKSDKLDGYKCEKCDKYLPYEDIPIFSACPNCGSHKGISPTIRILKLLSKLVKLPLIILGSYIFVKIFIATTYSAKIFGFTY